MSKISQNIVDQIKEDKITPKPRWQFVLRNTLLIAAVVMAIVVGGLVMSLVFLKVGDLDWEFVSINGERGLPRFFEVLPLLWMLTLVLVLLLAVWSFEKTESAYKIRPVWVVLGSVVASFVLAGVLYAVRGPEMMDEALRATLPAYDRMENERAGRFHLPGLGVLPGEVIAVLDERSFQMEDIREKMWTVEIMPKSPAQRVFKDLRAGQMIMVIGEVQVPDQFLASDIRAKRGMMIRVKTNLIKRLDQAAGEVILPPPFAVFPLEE